MDVVRSVLGAVVFLGLTVPTFAQTDKEVAMEAAQPGGATKPWRHVRGFGRVLNLTKLPLVIDEPGLYAIDRNWRIEQPGGVFELIQITADSVTLDLHGFEIAADIDPPGGTLFVISGGGVEIRNGGFSACCEEATAIRSTSGVRLHHLSIFSGLTMKFEGGATSLTDSMLSVRVEIELAAGSNLERNTLSCNRGFYCVRLLGEGNRVTDNKLTLYQGGGIGILGNRNLVINNTIEAIEAPDAREPFVVDGDTNVVRANTVVGGFEASSIFEINGTANTIDGNVLAPRTPTDRARVGMQFTADGNYYGDNRMAAVVPFALGGTVQIDWGDNVGY
jgi:hypothetical protein